MPTRNVVLTDRQATLIEALVRGGRYQNASEVIREGLRLLEQHEVQIAASLESHRAPAPVPPPSSVPRAVEHTELPEFDDAPTLIAYLDKLAEHNGSGMEPR